MTELDQLTDPSCNLAQTYLILGEKDVIKEKLILNLSARFGYDLSLSPDLWTQKSKKLTIDQTRKLRSWLNYKPQDPKGKKFLLIASEEITQEGQNALLKTLEEPIDSGHIFLILNNPGAALDTLRSRCQIINCPKKINPDTDIYQAVFEFLKSDIHERLAGLKSGRWQVLDPEQRGLEEILSHFEAICFEQIRKKGIEQIQWQTGLDLILKLKRSYNMSLNLPTGLIFDNLAIQLPVI